MTDILREAARMSIGITIGFLLLASMTAIGAVLILVDALGAV